ncbi:MAG: glycosyltransferase family 2 protein [Blastocatellales bacterium]
MSLDTPVAFFIFNRPDLTEIVFKSIAEAKPRKLFVIADGPRNEEESIKCRQARDVIEKVDWDCEVIKRYSDVNLGCGKNISSGISWVFDNADKAIIIEDDTLPVPTFYDFCDTLLNYYYDDERIMHISGTNVQMGQQRTSYSYYFSKYNHGCAWATWRRAWKYYDYDMKSWPEFKKQGLLQQICEDQIEVEFWLRIFDNMSSEDRIDTWDYQMNYSMWSQGGLAILPSVNMTTNLGFRADATHTIVDDGNPIANLPSHDIEQIDHPPFVVRHREADKYTFDYIYGGNSLRKASQAPVSISSILLNKTVNIYRNILQKN